ncbi:MAG: phosphocarrier protein HPr [Halobacteriovorax sp.]|nr:phosphocarrier protein HPr [Halobacteriovorax sp.]MEE3078378.1 HPr family phosphocarrier protein [Bdellovibrionota bacterium]
MERTLKVMNDEGLHARPAAILVKEANAFSSNVEVVVNGNATNAKSIMGLMALGLKKDSEFTIRAEGDDAETAVETLATLVNNKFNLH